MTDTIMKIATTFSTSTISSAQKRLVTSKISVDQASVLSQRANSVARNRYLILDVLGQGTFGQVVKCQNLKTQEVVAVKVIKNRTAYFNQSMMEVSVLDLVGLISVYGAD